MNSIRLLFVGLVLCFTLSVYANEALNDDEVSLVELIEFEIEISEVSISLEDDGDTLVIEADSEEELTKNKMTETVVNTLENNS